jgi:hypothetical protein
MLNNFLSSLPYTEYCERAGSTAWNAEPVNAATNLALFISAYYIWQLLKEYKITDWKYRFLPISVFLIGTGSTLYHTFRSPASMLADTAPIYLFFLVYFFLFVKIFVKQVGRAAMVTILFATTLLLLTIYTPRELLNGSIRHFFNAGTLLGMFLVARHKFGPKAKLFLTVFLVYSLAIFFRTIEPAVCPFFPVGTHFTWHLLNGLAAYLAVKALLRISRV